MRQAIGVGRSATPTPTGRYYVVELIQLTDPHGMYGPYAFGISAHSNVYTHFGSGDGEINRPRSGDLAHTEAALFGV